VHARGREGSPLEHQLLPQGRPQRRPSAAALGTTPAANTSGKNTMASPTAHRPRVGCGQDGDPRSVFDWRPLVLSSNTHLALSLLRSTVTQRGSGRVGEFTDCGDVDYVRLSHPGRRPAGGRSGHVSSALPSHFIPYEVRRDHPRWVRNGVRSWPSKAGSNSLGRRALPR
jgi:hypothetical protein